MPNKHRQTHCHRGLVASGANVPRVLRAAAPASPTLRCHQAALLLLGAGDGEGSPAPRAQPAPLFWLVFPLALGA